MVDTLGILCERGYVANYSQPLDELHELLNGSTTIYQGFDPTAPSLHVGHLESLMMLHYLQEAGHRIIFLLGGATGLVGDPSGREDQRPLLSKVEVWTNAQAIRRQVQQMGILRFDQTAPKGQPALLLNNADWLDMSLLTYLREVARQFSVSEMLRRETFARRLAAESHLSLLEFLYPTLQAYDYLYLFDKYECRLQIGGADQWGNIVDGIDLIRRMRGEHVHGLVCPLLMDRRGQKMGKTSSGETVWLDGTRTSPFAFYQYWVHSPDEDLKRNLEMFTFLPLREIEAILQGHPRQVQHRLAFEVTKIVHGEETAYRVQEDAFRVFGRTHGIPQQIPAYSLSKSDLGQGVTLITALSQAEAVPSRNAARRLIQQGGVYLNGRRVTDIDHTLTYSDFQEQDGELFALVQYGRGKALKLTMAQSSIRDSTPAVLSQQAPREPDLP